MSIRYKKIFSFLLLFSSIHLSHAFVSDHTTNSDVNKRIEEIDEQVKLISNRLTLQSAKSVEEETLRQLKNNLIAEKVLLENKMESYRKLEEKTIMQCTPPSIFR